MSRPWRLGIAAAQVLFTVAFAVGVYIDVTLLVPAPPSLPLSQAFAPAPIAATEREDRALMAIAPGARSAPAPASASAPVTTGDVAPVPSAPTISRALVPSGPVAARVPRVVAVANLPPVIGSPPPALAPTTPQVAALRPAVVASVQADAARPHARPAAPPFVGKDRSTPPRTHKASPTKPHV